MTSKQQKPGDTDLALLSIILGATSFMTTIFTGIPAIVTGVLALKRNSGNRAQAKIGIGFGIAGSLLLIPVILLAVHFLKTPFKEQFSIPSEDGKNLYSLAEKLEKYKKEHKSYPQCSTNMTGLTCTEWADFINNSGITKTYPTVFVDSSNIVDRPVGTLVVAYRTTCFLNVPTHPGIMEEDRKRVRMDDFAALVYFHEGGRACYSANKD